MDIFAAHPTHPWPALNTNRLRPVPPGSGVTPIERRCGRWRHPAAASPPQYPARRGQGICPHPSFVASTWHPRLRPVPPGSCLDHRPRLWTPLPPTPQGCGRSSAAASPSLRIPKLPTANAATPPCGASTPLTPSMWTCRPSGLDNPRAHPIGRFPP